ncbi:MAG: hypothetical protein ACRD0X_00320 [Thermoanaerobaculia bacterium]
MTLRFGDAARHCHRAVAFALLLLGTTSCGGDSGSSPTEPVLPSGIFGVVGGSVTRFAIQGYIEVGGTRSWSFDDISAYGGGHVALWAEQVGDPGSQYWAAFAAALARHPTTSQVWWHIMVRRRDDPPPVRLTPADIADLEAVAAEIRRRAPGTSLYASPLPDFDPAVGCTAPGTAGVELSRLMVDHVVEAGLAQRGPQLAPIDLTTYNGPSDPCHQGAAGRIAHGQDLAAFFGL